MAGLKREKSWRSNFRFQHFSGGGDMWVLKVMCRRNSGVRGMIVVFLCVGDDHLCIQVVEEDYPKDNEPPRLQGSWTKQFLMEGSLLYFFRSGRNKPVPVGLIIGIPESIGWTCMISADLMFFFLKPVEIKCHNECESHMFLLGDFQDQILRIRLGWDAHEMVDAVEGTKRITVITWNQDGLGFPCWPGERKIRDSRGLHHVRNEEKLGLRPHFSWVGPDRKSVV